MNTNDAQTPPASASLALAEGVRWLTQRCDPNPGTQVLVVVADVLVGATEERWVFRNNRWTHGPRVGAGQRIRSVEVVFETLDEARWAGLDTAYFCVLYE